MASKKKKGWIIVGLLTLVMTPVVAALLFLTSMVLLVGGAAGGKFGDKCYPDSSPALVLPSDINTEFGDSFAKYQQQWDAYPNGEEVKAEQAHNVETIISIGASRNLSVYDIQLALATAIQESDLQNLKHGHLDSAGLYQQRPSQGWGSFDQVTNPVYSINKFYDEVERLDGRGALPLIESAIRVQKPDPNAYRSRWQWDGIVAELTESLADEPSVGKLRADRPVQLADLRNEKCNPEKVIRSARVQSGEWQSPLDEGYQYLSPFGMRGDPLGRGMLLHNGADFAYPGSLVGGEPIYAIADGTVSLLRDEFVPAWGGYVTYIDHGDGILSGYAHQLRRADGLSEGDEIKAGDVIGYVGSTGGSSGPHLHFMITSDPNSESAFIDPIAFMKERGVVLD